MLNTEIIILYIIQLCPLHSTKFRFLINLSRTFHTSFHKSSSATHSCDFLMKLCFFSYMYSCRLKVGTMLAHTCNVLCINYFVWSASLTVRVYVGAKRLVCQIYQISRYNFITNNIKKLNIEQRTPQKYLSYRCETLRPRKNIRGYTVMASV